MGRSERAERFWLAEAAPELNSSQRRRDPSIDRITAQLDPDADVRTVRIPMDCSDWFTEALYARPEASLDPEVRAAQSAWGFVDDAVEERIVTELARPLESGEWDRRLGEWRRRDHFDGSLRLIVADVSG